MGAKVSNSVVEAARGHGRSRRVDQWLFCMVPDSARAFDTLHAVDRTKSRSAQAGRCLHSSSRRIYAWRLKCGYSLSSRRIKSSSGLQTRLRSEPFSGASFCLGGFLLAILRRRSGFERAQKSS